MTWSMIHLALALLAPTLYSRDYVRHIVLAASGLISSRSQNGV